MLNKPKDKTAIVKQGIQTLVSTVLFGFTSELFQDFHPIFQDNSNWADWGDNNTPAFSNFDTDADEKKRQREEKRLQRQKEIEAKRAAKKGPMKLGAKKSSNDDGWADF